MRVPTLKAGQRPDSAAQKENERLRSVLAEIAEASSFDNIGRWARSKARAALKPNNN